MVNATAKALRRVGIEIPPDELDRRIAQAVLDIVPPYAVSDPHAEFTAEERSVLEEGGADLSPLRAGEDDAIIRTAAEYAALLSSSLTVPEAARRLGVDGSRVRQRLGSRQMYGIRRSTGWLLPLFQFESDHLVSGLERVLPRLNPHLHPLAVVSWFSRPNSDLLHPDDPEQSPLSPIDWLRSGGNSEAVAELADDAVGFA